MSIATQGNEKKSSWAILCTKELPNDRQLIVAKEEKTPRIVRFMNSAKSLIRGPQSKQFLASVESLDTQSAN